MDPYSEPYSSTPAPVGNVFTEAREKAEVRQECLRVSEASPLIHLLFIEKSIKLNYDYSS